jgi:hypothetical protein
VQRRTTRHRELSGRTVRRLGLAPGYGIEGGRRVGGLGARRRSGDAGARRAREAEVVRVRDGARGNWGAGTGGEDKRKSQTARLGHEADSARGELARARGQAEQSVEEEQCAGRRIRSCEERIRMGDGGAA